MIPPCRPRGAHAGAPRASVPVQANAFVEHLVRKAPSGKAFAERLRALGYSMVEVDAEMAKMSAQEVQGRRATAAAAAAFGRDERPPWVKRF